MDAPKNILLIESDRAIASSLEAQLSALGYTVASVLDPATSESDILRLRPQLIILDVSVPENAGFAVLEKLRANTDSSIANIPVIIGSASGDIVEIGHALRLGIKDYFIKTKFDPLGVIDKVKKVIGPAIVTPQAGEAVAPSPQAGGQVRVLMIEDDRFLRDLATQKLARENFQVSSAVDGEQGVALAGKEVPDLILLDILLPGIDGFEVLRRLRAEERFAKTHIVMLSNFGQREDIEKALTSGADQFMVKANYTLDEIVDEVKKITGTPRGA